MLASLLSAESGRGGKGVSMSTTMPAGRQKRARKRRETQGVEEVGAVGVSSTKPGSSRTGGYLHEIDPDGAAVKQV